LVLDVKYGSGAFMKHKADAHRLAQSMVGVGARMGIRTTALLTDMNQPNGRLAGNAVEVDESLETLAGGGPEDLRELSVALAAEVLLMSEVAAGHAQARAILEEHLRTGRALAKFHEMVQAQGGNLDAPRPRAPASSVVAEESGFITAMDVEQLGLA